MSGEPGLFHSSQDHDLPTGVLRCAFLPRAVAGLSSLHLPRRSRPGRLVDGAEQPHAEQPERQDPDSYARSGPDRFRIADCIGAAAVTPTAPSKGLATCSAIDRQLLESWLAWNKTVKPFGVFSPGG